MAATLTSLNENLKKIVALLRRESKQAIVVTSPKVVHEKTRSVLIDIENNTDGLEALITSTNSILNELEVDNNAIIIDLAAMEVLLQTISTRTGIVGDNTSELEGDNDNIITALADINTELNTITGHVDILDTISTRTGTVADNTESTDENWNLFSVNQLNLAAILAAVLNNATSGRQDTSNTHLGNIDSVLDDIETRVDGLEGLISTTNTHVDGIEGLLTTMDAVLDNMLDQQYNTPSNDVGVLTITNGDLTKTMSISGGLVVELQALTITGEATASRTISIGVVINGTLVPLIDIVVVNNTVLLLDDTKWDRIRLVLLNLKLHSTSELRFTASGCTATESIIMNIGIVRRNS